MSTKTHPKVANTCWWIRFLWLWPRVPSNSAWFSIEFDYFYPQVKLDSIVCFKEWRLCRDKEEVWRNMSLLSLGIIWFLSDPGFFSWFLACAWGNPKPVDLQTKDVRNCSSSPQVRPWLGSTLAAIPAPPPLPHHQPPRPCPTPQLRCSSQPPLAQLLPFRSYQPSSWFLDSGLTVSD